MKGKFSSMGRVAIALVLALSLSLVTAVPAAAAGETLTVRPITLEASGGEGSAVWATEAYADDQSVQLSVTSGADGDDYAEVAITPVGIKVEDLDLDNTSFWCKSTVGENTPYFIFETDEGNRFNTDAASSAGYEDWAEYVASDTPEWQWYSDSTWHSWAETKTEYGTEMITCVIVECPGADMAEATPPFTSYVDDITVNGFTYELEEPDYNTIQAAITAADLGGTVNVAAGTYNEAVSIPSGKDGLEIAAGSAPILDGTGLGDVNGFNIASNNVKIHGFTIQNFVSTVNMLGWGIITEAGTSGGELYDNTVTSGSGGIYIHASTNYEVYDNNINNIDVGCQ